MPDDFRHVALPAELCDEAERRFSARFGTLEQFLAFVMRELLHDEAAKMDQAEQGVLERRLKDLGYI
jgi:hypothetical protein